jgi:hypothetical protein
VISIANLLASEEDGVSRCLRTRMWWLWALRSAGDDRKLSMDDRGARTIDEFADAHQKLTIHSVAHFAREIEELRHRGGEVICWW